MTAESDSDRQQRWTLVVRRSFGVPDLLDAEQARRELVRCLEEQLLESGWRSATRAVADPLVDALLGWGVHGDPDDFPFAVAGAVPVGPFPTRDAARQLIDQGLSVADPEHLVFDPTEEYPPEVVAVAALALERVFRYEGDQLSGE